jgi:hypothetical protein
LDAYQWNYSVVGNILGSPLTNGFSTAWAYESATNGNPDCSTYQIQNTTNFIYILGFPNPGNTAICTSFPNNFDTNVAATLFRNGNYDYANSNILWLVGSTFTNNYGTITPETTYSANGFNGTTSGNANGALYLLSSPVNGYPAYTNGAGVFVYYGPTYLGGYANAYVTGPDFVEGDEIDICTNCTPATQPAGAYHYSLGGNIVSNVTVLTTNSVYVNGPSVPFTNSLYLASKPGWWGSGAWPPFDPNNPSAASVGSIPAGYRYLHGVDPP